MLTQDQINTFCLATAANNNGGYEEDATLDDALCNADQVVETRDQIADFIAKWGQPEKEEYGFGTLYFWRNVQARKGARRGDLMVMDFTTARAAFFSGEA